MEAIFLDHAGQFEHGERNEGNISGLRYDKKIGTGMARSDLAAELGFEPRQTESESVVLPLHNSAISYCFSDSNYTGNEMLCQA